MGVTVVCRYTDLLTSIGTIHNNAKAKQIQRAEMESILSMRGVNKVRGTQGGSVVIC